MSTTTIDGYDTKAALKAIVAHWIAAGGSQASLCRASGANASHMARCINGDQVPSAGFVWDVASAAGLSIKLVLEEMTGAKGRSADRHPDGNQRAFTRAAKAVTEPAEYDDAELLAACRKLAGRGVISKAITDALRRKGLATKRGVLQLTSAGARLANRK